MDGATPDRRKRHPRWGGQIGQRIESGSAIACQTPPIPAATLEAADAILGAYFHILIRDTATPALGRHSTSTRRSGRAPSSDRLAHARSRNLFAPSENGSIFVRASSGRVADGMSCAY